MLTHSRVVRLVTGCCFSVGLMSWTAQGAEFKAGDEAVTVSVAPLMLGPDVQAEVPHGAEVLISDVKGEWVGVVWTHEGKEIKGWVHAGNLIGKSEFVRRAQLGKKIELYPLAKRLNPFEAHPQQSGNTCSAAASRNLLFHVTKSAPWEFLLFLEIVAEDHKGLAHLEGKLKQIGVDNPMALSAFGGTSVGIKAVINKRLPDGLVCNYQEIPDFDDRLLVIVRSINHGWPVICPIVSPSIQHWITITGYDRRARTFSTASYGTLSFERFNTLNSWQSIPGGILGRAFQLANEEHMGRNVLVYLSRTDGKD